MDYQETIEELIKELEAIKAQQKILSEQESSIKEQLLELMLDNGIDIRSLEIDLKERKKLADDMRKKLADDMGDYTVLGTKESIVFSPPKDIF